MRRKAIELLLTADDAPEFHKFLALPPEVRLIIYDLYMADFPQTLRNPVQPPLARTCKVVRHELLPAFYKRHTFEINFDYYDSVKRSDKTYRQGKDMHTDFRPSLETVIFLDGIPRRCIQDIRKLKLSFERLSTAFVFDRQCYVEVDLAQVGNEVTVYGMMPYDPEGDVRTEASKKVHDEVKVAMEEVIAGMSDGWTGKSFMLADLYDMRMAFQDVYNLGAVHHP